MGDREKQVPTGRHRPTVRDVALRAGVSKSLVSLVFKDPARVGQARRERVLVAARELGYSPNFLAQSLAQDGAPFIGIVVADLHNPLFSEIADAARAVFLESGQHSVMMSATLPVAGTSAGSRETDYRLLQMLGDLRPQGLLVVGTIPDLSALPQKVPLVFASATSDALGVSSVRSSEEEGVRLALVYLLEQGYERVCFVGGEGGSVPALRRAAFERLAADVGLEARVLSCASTEGAGYVAGKNLVKMGTFPLAVLAVNDLAALGVMTAVEEAGFCVPRDVGLVGFDNTSFAQNPRISLSSVDTQNQEVGAKAARLLLEEIAADESKTQEVLLMPQLTARGSSGAHPGK